MLQLVVDQIVSLIWAILNERNPVHIGLNGALHDVAMLRDKLVACNHNNGWIIAMVGWNSLPIGDDFTEPCLFNLGSPWLWNKGCVDLFLTKRDQGIRR
ncbi:hypothetical protein D3C86_1981480 [compost metagenome]